MSLHAQRVKPGVYNVSKAGREFWLSKQGTRWHVSEHYQRGAVGTQRTLGMPRSKKAALALIEQEVSDGPTA